MEDESIHMDLSDRNIIQPTAWSVAAIAWKCLILLQVISTSVFYFSPTRRDIHLYSLVITTPLGKNAHSDGVAECASSSKGGVIL